MINLKKITALGLSAMMLTSLVGCGGTTNESGTENAKTSSSRELKLLFGIALLAQMGICWLSW